MSKPPKTPPNSDIDGVREDEARNVDVANEAGQGTKDLAKAKAKSIGRPRYAEEKSRDDRGG